MTVASTRSTISAASAVSSATTVSAASALSAASAVADAGPMPSRPRPARRLVALACVVALSAGLGACTVNLDRGGSTDSQGSAGASSHSAADPSQEPSEDSDGGMPTPSGSPTALPPLTDQGGTASPDPERPGAGATITSKEWVRAQQSRDKKTMTPDNGQVVVDRSFATVVIEGDVTNLTVSGDRLRAERYCQQQCRCLCARYQERHRLQQLQHRAVGRQHSADQGSWRRQHDQEPGRGRLDDRVRGRARAWLGERPSHAALR